MSAGKIELDVAGAALGGAIGDWLDGGAIGAGWVDAAVGAGVRAGVGGAVGCSVGGAVIYWARVAAGIAAARTRQASAAALTR